MNELATTIAYISTSWIILATSCATIPLVCTANCHMYICTYTHTSWAHVTFHAHTLFCFFLLFTTLLEKTALRNIHAMDQSHEELYHFGNLRNANSEAEHQSWHTEMFTLHGMMYRVNMCRWYMIFDSWDTGTLWPQHGNGKQGKSHLHHTNNDILLLRVLLSRCQK